MKWPIGSTLIICSSIVFFFCQRKPAEMPCRQDLTEWNSTMVRHYWEDTLRASYCEPIESLFGVPVKELDSMYLFQGNGGLGGGFYFMCALYPQEGTYRSKLIRLTIPPFSDRDNPPKHYDVIEQEISAGQWRKVGQLLRDSGFWCLSHRLQEGGGIDGPEYYLASKEANNFRLVRFQAFPWFSPKVYGEASYSHKITPAAAYILEFSGCLSEPYFGVFDQLTRDSFNLYFGTFSLTFAQMCRLRLEHQILLDWTNSSDASAPLRLHRRLLDSIPYMIVEEKMFSRRVRKVALKKPRE